MAKKGNVSTGTKMAIGAGVVGMAGAAYLLFGPAGKKHQKELKSWMLKMKAEALEKMEELKELSAPAYETLVSDLEAKYKKMKNVDAKELANEVAKLKKNFRAATKAKGAKKVPKKAPAQKKARK